MFTSDGVPLAGRFFRSTHALDRRAPLVIVTGSWLTVKEQMAATYARALAERGVAAFTFDFSGFGESGGSLRQAELPARKIDDIGAAARFVDTMSFVEPGAVGYLAVCASAQYALRALARGAPIRAFASVAGWFHDAASVAPFYGGEEGVRVRLARAAAAQERFARTGELTMVPAYAAGDERAGMFFELDYYANPARGAVPAWRNEMAELSWPYWLAYDGLSPARHVSAPTLIVHGDECALPDNARRVHAALRGETSLVWVSGSQTDFYDAPARVTLAADAAAAWFARTLT